MGISKRYAAARLLSVLLILGVLTLLAVSCQNNPPAPASGMITVNLINATGHDTEMFYIGIYKESVDYISGTADGIGVAEISAAGEAQATALNAALTDVMIFTGGGRYYVWAFVDVNSSMAPDSNDFDYVSSVFTVDGNMTQTLDFNSFALVP